MTKALPGWSVRPVITSYSIHYTKLYERPISPWILNSTAPSLADTLRMGRTASAGNCCCNRAAMDSTWPCWLSRLSRPWLRRWGLSSQRWARARLTIRYRITSYNVCYTKLLRPGPCCPCRRGMPPWSGTTRSSSSTAPRTRNNFV